MRQKYTISRNDESGEMRIQEYAVVDNDSYRKEKYMLTDADFVLLSEQSYPAADIEKAISGGREDVIAELRTDEFFPVRLCAEKIADSVVELFDLEGDRSIVLIYDDKDGFGEDNPEKDDAAADTEEAEA